MTENEALKLVDRMVVSRKCEIIKTLELKAVILNALEEIQQYRAIGTVEELQAYKNGSCTNNCNHYDSTMEYVRAKAIDDFAEKIMEYCSMSDMNRKMIAQIAEQLKGEKP